jgi:N-acetylglucosamine kinase-like BadF-type ATPase
VEDARTGVVAATTEGAARPDGGPESPVALIAEAAGGLPAGRVGAVCAGITKITRGDTQERWEAALSAALPRVAAVRVLPDYVIAFHGAVENGRGLAVIAGTGSVVYGEDGHGNGVRVGGRGWEFGDEGSGTWLTAEMVRRALRALDGLDAPTPLTGAVCVALGTDDPAMLGEAARTRAAAEGRGFFVPLLLERANSGDEEARNLFVGAGGWLAAQARAAAERLGIAAEPDVPVATVGGLWSAGELLLAPFENALRRRVPGARIHAPLGTPVEGAARLARADTVPG